MREEERGREREGKREKREAERRGRTHTHKHIHAHTHTHTHTHTGERERDINVLHCVTNAGGQSKFNKVEQVNGSLARRVNGTPLHVDPAVFLHSLRQELENEDKCPPLIYDRSN